VRALIAILLVCPMLAAAAAGCGAATPLAYYFSPRHIQKSEYAFPGDARVAVLIEPARPDAEHPVFNRALYERLAETFREKKSKAALLPLDEVTTLRSQHADFASWSIQRIGRTLHASHVLYIRIDELQLRTTPEVPVIEPRVTLHEKVILVDSPEHDARAWPKEQEGRLVTCSRPSGEVADAGDEDDAVRKLGLDTAYFVAMPFFETDLEEKRPVER
jgi:hypothetical protein